MVSGTGPACIKEVMQNYADKIKRIEHMMKVKQLSSSFGLFCCFDLG